MKTKKNKGSAMVLSILLLAFFMALSLNMFYITMKKGQRAGFKVKGQTVFSGIDESTTVGYHELYLAGELVNIGSLFDASHPAITGNGSYFTDPASYTTEAGTIYVTSGTALSYQGTYAGIAISNYTEYFNSAWNISSLGDFDFTTNQAIVLSNSVDSDGTLLSRTWSGDSDKSYRLWMDGIYTDYISIGGYTLEEFAVDNSSESVTVVSDGSATGNTAIDLSSGSSITATAEYEKIISISDITYTITVDESITFSPNDNIDTDNLSKSAISVDSEQLTNIVIVKKED